jgi:formylglycine-generating enzyme required for sulfatase activity
VGGWTDAYKTDRLVMRKIRAGTFTMGSPADELGRTANELQHTVELTRSFYIGVFEVTQWQWELVMGTRPSYFDNTEHYATRPVEQVSYYVIRENPNNTDDPDVDWPANSNVTANSFMGLMRQKTGLTTLDLPTEAQWEYACRAGTTTALNNGTNLTSTQDCPNMAEVGRYRFNGGYEGYGYPACTPSTGTAIVGAYQPNEWGLYDMHGNALEWCLDWFTTYPEGKTVDPVGGLIGYSGSVRVRRGGYWYSSAAICRSARRHFMGTPDSGNLYVGLRVTVTLP